tara:strand:+ start:871 stop:1737 length:867 start_codon:yes stop_codon:yes gene_type:complete
MKKIFLIASFFLYLTSNVFAADIALNCQVDSDGKFDRTQFASAMKVCFVPATSYVVTYEMVGLCTKNPETEIRAGRNIDNVCHYLLETTDDPIVVNMTNTASTSWNSTVPGVGTYTHAIIITKNEYTVTGEMEFNGIIAGSNEARNDWQQGRFCGPPNGDYKISTLYGSSLSGGNLLATCYANSKGSSPQSGTLTVDSLSSSAFDADIVGVGVLLDASGEIATNEAATKSFVQAYEFPTPFTITPNTTTLTYGVSTDQAMRIITNPAGVAVVALIAYLGDVNFKVEAN